MGVQGFPTLKIVTPSKKPGKPRVEDYQGQRTAKGIVDAVVDRIPNHVKRATDKDLANWVAQNEDRPKAILFTEKGTTSSLIRALAIDFLGAIDVAQVRSKESASVKKFGVSQFPALVVVPQGTDSEPKLYEGELKKKPMSDFLSQFAEPNPDATGKAAPSSSKPKSKAKPKPSKSAKPASDTKSDEEEPSDSKPTQEPIAAPPVPALETPEELKSKCLGPKTNTVVLALVKDSDESNVLSTLSELAHKYTQRGAQLFPLYNVPSANSASQSLRTQLGLGDSSPIELVAVNARRGWWRRYENTEYLSTTAIEAWFDAIRLGDGTKEKLPEGIVDSPRPKEESEHDEL